CRGDCRCTRAMGDNRARRDSLRGAAACGGMGGALPPVQEPSVALVWPSTGVSNCRSPLRRTVCWGTPGPIRRRGSRRGPLRRSRASSESWLASRHCSCAIQRSSRYGSSAGGCGARRLDLRAPSKNVAQLLIVARLTAITAARSSRLSPAAPVSLSRTTCANMRSIFYLFAENAEIADWLAERGGFEPPVSREVFPKENGRECWDISGRNRLTSSREWVRF